MHEHLQAIVTVLSLVNPLMCAAMFVQAEGARSRGAQLADATRAALAVLVILVLAALCGTWVLHLFGVSLDAFSVAGGGVLAWIGFSMLRGSPTGSGDGSKEGSSNQTSLTPLILFAASPGTITGVITLAAVHTSPAVRLGDKKWTILLRDGPELMIPVTALVAVAVAVVVMWVVMVLVARKGHSGGGFVRDTATRFMGLIVVAMGVQFALTGLRAFMAGST